MKKLGLLSLLAVSLLFSAQSCKDNSAAKEEARESLSTQNNQSQEATAQAATPPTAPKVEEEPLGPTTTIKFEEEAFDFGKVMQGEIVYHTYSFTNTGDEPLIIKSAKASCGCTVPDWPRNPIAPGDSGKIDVKFDTKGRGKPGGKPQNKRVTVIANTNPTKTYVTIKGLVDKVDDGSTPPTGK